MERPDRATSSEGIERQSRLGSAQQVELLDALRGRHGVLAQCYEGALRALLDDRNPDGLAQAAHSTRELFDYLPLAVRDDVPKKPADLKSAVRAIVDEWHKAVSKTTSLTEQGWVREIDAPLSRLLLRIADFVRWFENEHPTYGVEQDMVLDQFDPARRQLPPQLRALRGSVLRHLQRYMNAVAHHNIAPTRPEFMQKLAEAEALIRGLVRPEPYVDRKLMDEILRGGA